VRARPVWDVHAFREENHTMQVALGRLQFSVVVAPREKRRQPPAPSAEDVPLERAFRHEQRLQQIEAERMESRWCGILAAPRRGEREHRHRHATVDLPDDPWRVLRRVQ
jgi:hypothetical protein